MQLGDALRRAANELAVTARSADPTRRPKSTPEWTAADVVAHVAIEARRYRRELEGDSEWSASGGDIPETNRRALAAHTERDLSVDAASVVADVDRYVELLEQRDPDTPSHHLDGGLVLAPKHAAGLLLGELTLHRRDLARAMGEKVEVRRDDAHVIVNGAMRTLPGMLIEDRARGQHATIEVRVRGGDTCTVIVDDGTARVIDGRASTRDAVISADPLGFLLLSYGRRGQVATLVRGHVLAWGRRLDKAAALDRLFHRP